MVFFDMVVLWEKKFESMLLEAKLFPLKKKADNGDPDAQIEIGNAFFHGINAPVNYAEAKRYLILLSENDPDDLPQIGYGTLLYFIGETCRKLGQMDKANEWYQKSKDYFRETYEDDFGNELIGDFKLENLIAETERKIALQ